jgi:hypothetical protein
VVLEKDGKDIWTDPVENEEVLHTVKENRNRLPSVTQTTIAPIPTHETNNEYLEYSRNKTMQ